MKRIASIQDLSCIGKCSLGVALPVLSVMGLECAALPTAVLSAHTAFEGFVTQDLTGQIEPIAAHWQQLELHFDAVYTGYLATAPQVRLVQALLRRFSPALRFVDPAMADNGRLYAGFDADFPPVMAALCAEADYITPNITEACLLTGTEYRELHDGPYLRRLLDGLRALGAKNVILTGVRQDPAHMAVAVMDASGRFFLRTSEYVPGVFHGAGDLFASVCAGALTLGWTAGEAAGLAAEYVARTIRATVRDSEARWYGLSFESTLPTLAELLQHRRNFHAFTE